MGIGSKTCQAPKPQAVRSVGWEEDIGRREDMEDGFIFIDEYSVEPREFDEVPKKTTKKVLDIPRSYYDLRCRSSAEVAIQGAATLQFTTAGASDALESFSV